ncbi:hypothetical protein ACFPRL_27975 [Pseudoclavibacter helvolus]
MVFSWFLSAWGVLFVQCVESVSPGLPRHCLSRFPRCQVDEPPLCRSFPRPLHLVLVEATTTRCGVTTV